MGMQEKVDCDDDWGEKGSASMSPGESLVYENEAGGGALAFKRCLVRNKW